MSADEQRLLIAALSVSRRVSFLDPVPDNPDWDEDEDEDEDEGVAAMVPVLDRTPVS
jgi:hypothetical protein